MKMERAVIGIVALLMLPALSLHAQSLDVKPGLWELTSTTNISGTLIPSDALKNMPPEQRARVEASMRARQAKGTQAHTFRSCWSKDKLDRPLQDQSDKDSQNCTHTVVAATRTRAEYKIQCTGPNAHHGVITIEALSRERVKETVKMSTDNGAVSGELTGTWIAESCGNVK